MNKLDPQTNSSQIKEEFRVSYTKEEAGACDLRKYLKVSSQALEPAQGSSTSALLVFRAG
jgi:hypothetical protein